MDVIKNESLKNFTFEAEDHLEKIELTKADLLLLGSSDEEIIEAIKQNFEFAKTESNLHVQRFLTDEEIEVARVDNLNIVENELPDQEEAFALVEMEAKQMIREGRALLNSYRDQSRQLAKYVRNGKEEVNIDSKDVYRIALNGYFVHLLIIEGTAKPVKISKIPESELEKWYTESDALKSKMFFDGVKEAK